MNVKPHQLSLEMLKTCIFASEIFQEMFQYFCALFERFEKVFKQVLGILFSQCRNAFVQIIA